VPVLGAKFEVRGLRFGLPGRRRRSSKEAIASMIANPISRLSEAIRAGRVSLLRSDYDATPNIFLVTSSLPVPANTPASVLLAVALGLGYRGRDWLTATAALARAAVGDHRNCALQFLLAERPISLEEAAQRYGAAYRVLATLPPSDVMTAVGPAHVLERHSCVYGGRRFAHIVFEYDMSGPFGGSPFVCDGVDVIAVADGLVTRKDTYLDYIKLTEQIGEMPSIGAAV